MLMHRHRGRKPSPVPECLGLESWCTLYANCCSSILPQEIASHDPKAILDFSVQSGPALVRAVSTELAEFPGAAEALFLALALKKWRFADTSVADVRQKEAIDGFRRRNILAGSLASADRITREAMRRILAKWLPFQGIAAPRFGPGSVAERYSHARRWQVIERWLAAGYDDDLIGCADAYKMAKAVPWGDFLYVDQTTEVISNHNCSRLCAVPKDWNKDRLITVEPAFKSFLQQAARSSILESVHAGPLRGSAMDLYADGQSIQRALAREGSASGKLDTLDLKDASDNITAEFVFDVFPPWVTCLLEQCRTQRFCTSDGDESELHIYAGMGNATTFIVETLLFAAYCRAIAWRHGLKGIRVSVFGDDIICSHHLAEVLLDSADDFFRINSDKSFCGSENHLRESCGIYALNGRDVTPPRINGFRDTAQGHLGLATWIMANWRSDTAYRVRLATSTAQLAMDRNLIRNWPFLVEETAAVSIPALPYDPLPPLRMHKDYQVLEAKVEIESQSKARVPSDRIWALQGALAGVVRTRGEKNTYVEFPIRDSYEPPRKRWMRVTGEALPCLTAGSKPAVTPETTGDTPSCIAARFG